MRSEKAAYFRSKRKSKATETRETIDVYDVDLTFVILGVAPERVAHRPDASVLAAPAPGLPSMLLCPNFETDGGCALGSQCKLLHVDTSGLSRREIHVNRAWRSLAAVPHELTPAGTCLSVYAPNHRQPSECVECGRTLLTNGSEAALESAGRNGIAADGSVDPSAPSHCAHFYFNRMCNRGRTCRYIHVVHIDPTAADGQLVEAPPCIAGLRARRHAANQLIAKKACGLVLHTKAHECDGDDGLHVSDEDEEMAPTDSAPNSANLDDDEALNALMQQLPAAVSGQVCHTTVPVEVMRVYRHDPYRRW